MDIAARDMMKKWQDDYHERRDELVRVLGINLDWRMHECSDGQRKKVRIMLKLLRPFKLCVIDEFAADLDIFSRKRFFDYLTKECELRGAAVVDAWAEINIKGSPSYASSDCSRNRSTRRTSSTRPTSGRRTSRSCSSTNVSRPCTSWLTTLLTRRSWRGSMPNSPACIDRSEEFVKTSISVRNGPFVLIL